MTHRQILALKIVAQEFCLSVTEAKRRLESDPDELVKEYWEDVGLKTVIKPVGQDVGMRWEALDHTVSAHEYSDVTENKVYLGAFRMGAHGVKEAPAWQKWLVANEQVLSGDKSLEDFEGGELPGEEPPVHVKQQWERLRNISNTRFGSQEYRQLALAIGDYQAEYLYAIGTVGEAPTVLIVNENLGNVPKIPAPEAGDFFGLYYDAQQLFWKE